MVFIKFSKFSQREFGEIWEENFPFFLHFILHIDDLLLGGGDTEGVQGGHQILEIKIK